MSRTRKILIALAAIAVLVVGALLITIAVLNQPRPDGQAGAEADALARRVMKAVNVDAWNQVGAVAWNFGGRQQHLWDRGRNLARVQWGEHEAIIDLTTKKGIAKTDGQVVEGADGEALVAQAVAHWINDSFWLNPIAKFFDAGVIRERVETEGGEALLIRFGDVGLTGGDAYLWHLDADGRPERWQMWVSIIPIGGLNATWAGWTTLDGGAQISTEHDLQYLFVLELTDVRIAADAATLAGGSDPFVELGEPAQRAPAGGAAVMPSSAPAKP